MARTEKELDDAIGRIGYSVELLSDAASWIATHHRHDPDDLPAEWNVHIEAFLVHARKLAEFLDPTGNRHPNDIRPGDFLPAEKRYPIGIGCIIRDQISKRVAHFSHVPVPNNREVMEWPIEDMAVEIRDAVAAFTGDLRRSDPARCDRIDRALTATQPRFRKVVQGRNRNTEG